MISSCGLSRFSGIFDGDGPLNRDTTVHILYGMLVLEYQECVVSMGRSLDFPAQSHLPWQFVFYPLSFQSAITEGAWSLNLSVTAMTIVTRKGPEIRMTKKRYLHKFFAPVISYLLSFGGIFMLKTCVIFTGHHPRVCHPHG